jgi:hypothetical protein
MEAELKFRPARAVSAAPRVEKRNAPHNRLVETDTQRQGATRRAGDRTLRGALPLCAAHRQRYDSVR